MKLKKGKKLLALSLITVLSFSAMNPAYAVQNSTQSLKQTGLVGFDFNTDVKEPPIKTSGKEEVPYPERLPKAKDMDQVHSFSTSDFADTKAVAAKVASYLTTGYGETSVQYALIDNGQIVLSGTAGDYSKTEKTALTKDNMYGIASISKIFTSAAVMNLVEDGRINLDTPVAQYITDFKMADERYQKITVRMLLNHSSGLMGSSFHNALLFDDNDTYAHDTFLQQLQTQRLKADPGAYSVYCNDGFTLAEILVERVTGMSFTNYVSSTFLSPLSMEDTKTPISLLDNKRLSKTYYADLMKALPRENFNTIGAGGFYSSAEDLCTFATTFMRNSNGILTQDSLKAMENKEYDRGIWPEAKDNVIGYGLGWDCVDTYPFNQYGIKALAKGGDSRYYHSNLTVLPDQNMAVAVLSSSGSSAYDQLAAQQILLAALKEKGTISEIKPDKTFTAPAKVALPQELKKYEGYYAAQGALLKIKMNDAGALTLTYPQVPIYGTQTLIYTQDGKFTLSDGSGKISFTQESNGETYLEQSVYNTLPYLGQTASDEYAAQKIDISQISGNVAKTWANRDGKKYYMLNEKYSSISYLLGEPNLEVSYTKGFEGYLGINKIIDENKAVAILNGPGQMSRDISDYNFYKKGNVEYLSIGDYLYVEDSQVKTLSTKSKFTCKIKNDGYTVWYKVGKKSANKKVVVTVPKKANFVVYDSEGNIVNNSLVTKSYKVTLPKNGTIGFLGSKDAKFTVQYK